mmetsp:Transcript_16922/g.30355  ORF Transcript_16922/g.30355 Transcript_16922/m.30355 type:complete len:174 (+) Transcript_16922:1463-1984(+)
MSTGVLDLVGRQKRQGIKLNTKRLRTERYLQSYGSVSGRISLKDRPNRLHIRRSSVVTNEEKITPSNPVRRTFSLIPQKFSEGTLKTSRPLSSSKLQLKPKIKHRELSQAFREAMLKPLTPSKGLKTSKFKQKLYKFDGTELTSSKTTRTSNLSTKPDDSLLSLLEALEKVSL